MEHNPLSRHFSTDRLRTCFTIDSVRYEHANAMSSYSIHCNLAHDLAAYYSNISSVNIRSMSASLTVGLP